MNRIGGREEKEVVHVKNTGRCRSFAGAECHIQRSDNPDRKTQWDLIAVEKDGQIINMDSQVPNKAVEEWIREESVSGCDTIKPGVQVWEFRMIPGGDRRRKVYRGQSVTLKGGETARFPDAPSDRAVKHLEELIRAVEKGWEAYVFFVIQMKGGKRFCKMWILTRNLPKHCGKQKKKVSV